MPTVSLAISRCWITDPSDPTGDRVVCGSVETSPVLNPADGELQQFAGNRSRPVVRDQTAQQLPYTLVRLSPADVQQLLDWRGRVLLLRTMDGQRAFSVYFDVPYRRFIGTIPDDDPDGIVTYDADLTFNRVSYSEDA